MYEKSFLEGYYAALEQIEYIDILQEEFDKIFTEEDVIRYLIEKEGCSLNEAIDIYNEGFLQNAFMKRFNPSKYAIYQQSKQQRKVRETQDRERQAQSNYATVVSRQDYNPNNKQEAKATRKLQKIRNKSMKATDKAVMKYNKENTPKKPGAFSKAANSLSAWNSNRQMKSGKKKFEKMNKSRPQMNIR